jgi:molecular chaperone GrpE
MAEKKHDTKRVEEEHLNEENAGNETTGSQEAAGGEAAAPDDDRFAELQARLEQLQKENEALKDRYLRKAAEFENYKRRTEQEFASFTKYAYEQLLVDILPVLDDFERSLNVSKDRREFGPFYKGVELIFEKFKSILNAKGVQPIESVGQTFDVDLHDALMQVSRDDVAPNTIVEEVERGYKYNDKVIRHAKVVVAKEPGPADNEENEVDDGGTGAQQRRGRE